MVRFITQYNLLFLAKILEEIEKSEVFSEGLKEPNPNAVFVDFTPEVALSKLLTLKTASPAEKFCYFRLMNYFLI